MNETIETTTPPSGEVTLPETSVATRKRHLTLGGLDRYAVFYLWAAVIVLFGILVPDTFLSSDTLRLVLSDQAITGMLAIGALLPFAAGLFDLSFAAVAGFAMVMVSSLMLNSDFSDPVCVLLTVLSCASIGAISGFVVVRIGVSSFVVTLAMSSVVLGVTSKISGGGTIQGGLTETFRDVGLGSTFGIPRSFLYLVALAALVYYVLEWTPTGRRLFAIGGNEAAARLSGVRVDRLRFGALVASSTIAGLAGVILAAKVGIASDSAAPAFLLPAIAAVFLGSTQIKDRFNVVGTLAGVYLLATGTKGLQLNGVEPWVIDFFNGLALLVAVSIAAIRHRAG